jgi:uncharacterized protein
LEPPVVIAIFFLISVALVSGFYPLVEPPREEIQIAPAVQTSGRVYTDVVPAAISLHKNLVRQNFDFSCGSAALATVLNYQMGENLTERQVITGLLRYGDKETIISRRAFSLLDMKRFVEMLGYKGVGYTAGLQDLKSLGRPCIIPVTIFDYRHFVVFKGIHRGHIFLADPWRGNTSYSLKEFEAMWYRNAIFVVYPKNGGRELNALQLKEEDLRLLDEYTIRDFIFNTNDWPQTREWEMDKTFPPEGSVQSKHFDAYRSVEMPPDPAPGTP